MSAQKWTVWFFASLLAFGLALSLPTSSLAQDAEPEVPSNCIVCHEDLYYLFDTGKHYCVTEARQRCTDCHGGDPAATDKDAAHYKRSAHPVINEDVSACQQCHPTDCDEYVQKFAQIAGISPVFVAVKPDLMLIEPVAATRQPEPPVAWTMLLPILAGTVLIFLALAAFAAHLRHRA
jgi:hypothetical protein